ncbi:MAG: hypothetical protein WC455_14705 [Dehalococcoidia bacterium]|jgi:hypothetical protein
MTDLKVRRKIAEALGATVYKDWDPSNSTTSLMAEHTRITLSGVVLFESWKEEGKNEVYVWTDWPDFSAPEWQIKIQEKVRELWCKSGQKIQVDYSTEVVDLYLNKYEDSCWGTAKGIANRSTDLEAWTDVLLWLAKRKGVK